MITRLRFPLLNLALSGLLAFQLAACGGGGGGGGSDSSYTSSLDQNLRYQNTEAATVSSKMAEFFQGYQTLKTAYESTGGNPDADTFNNIISQMENTLIPAMEAAAAAASNLDSAERSIESFARSASDGVARTGVASGVHSTEQVLEGLLILAGIAGAWATAANWARSEVDKCKDQDPTSKETWQCLSNVMTEGGSIKVLEGAANAHPLNPLNNLPEGGIKVGMDAYQTGGSLEAIGTLFGGKCENTGKRMAAASPYASNDPGSYYIGSTDGSGSFPNVPAGDWRFVFYKDGYARTESGCVTVSAGRTTGVDMVAVSIDDATIQAIENAANGLTASESGDTDNGDTGSGDSGGSGDAGDTFTYPAAYSGTTSEILKITSNLGNITCSYGNSITITLNADGSVTGSTTISSYALLGDGGFFCSSQSAGVSISGSHSGGSFTAVFSFPSMQLTGTYTQTALSGSGSYDEPFSTDTVSGNQNVAVSVNLSRSN